MKLTKYFVKKVLKGNHRDLGLIPNLEGDGGTFKANLVITLKPCGKFTQIKMELVNDKGKRLMKYADINFDPDICDTVTVTGLSINHNFTLDSPF